MLGVLPIDVQCDMYLGVLLSPVYVVFEFLAEKLPYHILVELLFLLHLLSPSSPSPMPFCVPAHFVVHGHFILVPALLVWDVSFAWIVVGASFCQSWNSIKSLMWVSLQG